MNKTQALTERARLQNLLDTYEIGRLPQEDAILTTDGRRDQVPDRAGKVRARIAGLDQLIAQLEREEGRG